MMSYDVRNLHSVGECKAAIAGYENEIMFRHDFKPLVSAYKDAISTLEARIAELNGRSVSWCS